MIFLSIGRCESPGGRRTTRTISAGPVEVSCRLGIFRSQSFPNQIGAARSLASERDERLGRALEIRLHVRRDAQLLLGAIDLAHGVRPAVRRQAEGNRCHRKLSLVTHNQGQRRPPGEAVFQWGDRLTTNPVVPRYPGDMGTTLTGSDSIRRSISLPAGVAEKIDAIAASRRVSGNRTIVDLLTDAIEAYEQRRAAFLELAGRFQESSDPGETERLREELARMTFGL